jgi:hypothetical protein
MTKLSKILTIWYVLSMLLFLFLQSRTGVDYDYILNQNIYYIEFYYVKIWMMFMYIISAIYLLHWLLLLAGKTLKKQTTFENHLSKY